MMAQNWPGPSAPQAPPPPTPWSNKSHKVAWAVGLAALVFVGLSALGHNVQAKAHTVTYKLEGTTTMASITYENSAGDTSQQNDIDVPMTRKSDGGNGITLNGMHRGAFLYISAQNSKEHGSITCVIEVDGVRVKENTSIGGYTIASCSMRL